MADTTHLGGRVAHTTAESQAAVAEALRLTDLAALRLGQHIAAADAGAVLRFVNQLEHGSTWEVDPWRLVERLALRAMRRHPPEDPAGAAEDGAAAEDTSNSDAVAGSDGEQPAEPSQEPA